MKLASIAVAMSVVAFATAASGQAPPPAALAPPPMSAAAALQGEATYAELAAYEQYVLYLALVSNQSAPGPAPDLSQYFSNGAAMTAVPAAGQPGSSYFSNGAVVTSVPPAGQPGSAYFSNGAEVTSPRLTGAPRPPQPPPAPVEATPWTPIEEPIASMPPAPVPPPAPAPAVVTTEGTPMSFEAWLGTIRLAVGDTEASGGATAAAPAVGVESEALPIVEPAATANDERQRATYSLPEKPAEHAIVSRHSRRFAALVTGAFAVGLLLGALLMRTRRPRGGRLAH